MGPESSSHKVTITPSRWLLRRSSQTVDRSLTRPEAGGFSSQTASTSTSVTFSQGVFPLLMSAPQDLWAAVDIIGSWERGRASRVAGSGNAGRSVSMLPLGLISRLGSYS
jgi:hypothetical protein